jgi:hypothetical protein
MCFLGEVQVYDIVVSPWNSVHFSLPRSFDDKFDTLTGTDGKLKMFGTVLMLFRILLNTIFHIITIVALSHNYTPTIITLISPTPKIHNATIHG